MNFVKYYWKILYRRMLRMKRKVVVFWEKEEKNNCYNEGKFGLGK